MATILTTTVGNMTRARRTCVLPGVAQAKSWVASCSWLELKPYYAHASFKGAGWVSCRAVINIVIIIGVSHGHLSLLG